MVEEGYVVLSIERGSNVRPMSADFALKDGDVATIAVHDVDADEARARLEAIGWMPLREGEEVEAEGAEKDEASGKQDPQPSGDGDPDAQASAT
jgi:hypothetical protein